MPKPAVITLNLDNGTFHVRVHESGARPRLRIWTSAMEAVGQFNVFEFHEIEALWDILCKLGIGKMVFHHGDDDDFTELTYGESLIDYI